MKIAKLGKDELELTLNFGELDGIKNCLNEVWGGFKMTDFEKRIGASDQEVSNLADKMVDALADKNAPPVQKGSENLPLYVRRLLNRK
jgi:hypothetical protein